MIRLLNYSPVWDYLEDNLHKELFKLIVENTDVEVQLINVHETDPLNMVNNVQNQIKLIFDNKGGLAFYIGNKWYDAIKELEKHPAITVSYLNAEFPTLGMHFAVDMYKLYKEKDKCIWILNVLNKRG